MTKKLNRLSQETSLYLKQHQENPVDWYPWGEEALQAARQQNKPILLSVGYSACHWCHVMAHECFENPEIAQKMNELFINIKVDREERPDLDHLYQPVAQAITRSGGWPLTVFLSPDLKPFFGGTYFPPRQAHGRPGFLEVLEALGNAYQKDPSAIAENSKQLVTLIERIQGAQGIQAGSSQPTMEDFKSFGSELLELCDPIAGGLSGAPKFPNTMVFTALWRLSLLARQEAPRDAVVLALRKMAQGGIFDQLGGGFHRYSVDATWSVPHFEKMLYDNALLLKLYSEVLAADQEHKLLNDEDRALFMETVQKTTHYLLKEMQDPQGGFYSATDADSAEEAGGHKEEGKYFIWKESQLQFLSELQKKIFTLHYGVTSEGNFEEGATVLFQAHPLRRIATQLHLPEERVQGELREAQTKALEVRAKRPYPGRDEKIIISWNGLALSGLSWAALVLSKDKGPEAKTLGKAAKQAAQMAFERITGLAKDKLCSSIQEGKPKGVGLLEDYAAMAMAALDLSRVETDSKKMEALWEYAQQWLKVVAHEFTGAEGLGFFMTPKEYEPLLVRPKALFDQAIPSGTSLALQGLIWLECAGLGWPGLGSLLDVQIRGLFSLVSQNPYSCAELWNAAMLESAHPALVSHVPYESWVWHPYILRNPATLTELSAESQEPQICQNKQCQKINGNYPATPENIFLSRP